MLLSLAWKNCWRNKLRSSIIMGSLTLGLLAGTFMVGFMNGWINEKLDTTLRYERPQLEIKSAMYREDPDLSHGFMLEQRMLALDTIEGVAGVAPRLNVDAVVGSAYNSLGVRVHGVDPVRERLVCQLYEMIADTMGCYLDRTERPYPIVVGEKLCEKLRVKVGSKVVLSMLSRSGEQVSGAFRIVGVYHTTNSLMEQSEVFVRRSELSPLVGVDSTFVHEIDLALSDHSDQLLAQVQARVKVQVPQLSVMNWKEVDPLMELYSVYMDYMLFIMLGFILFALSFGIINSVLMSVLEREHELGMLQAIGMGRGKIYRMIMAESLFLTLTGGGLGLLLALCVLTITHYTGIDVSAIYQSLDSLGFNSVIYPSITIGEVVKITLLILLTGVLSAIYPARKALEKRVVDAIRKG